MSYSLLGSQWPSKDGKNPVLTHPDIVVGAAGGSCMAHMPRAAPGARRAATSGAAQGVQPLPGPSASRDAPAPRRPLIPAPRSLRRRPSPRSLSARRRRLSSAGRCSAAWPSSPAAATRTTSPPMCRLAGARAGPPASRVWRRARQTAGVVTARFALPRMPYPGAPSLAGSRAAACPRAAGAAAPRLPRPAAPATPPFGTQVWDLELTEDHMKRINALGGTWPPERTKPS